MTAFRGPFRPVRVFALTCLVAATVLTVAASAQTPGDVLIIETTGTGPVIRGNPAAAEKEAVRDALDLAVAEALKTILSPEVLAGHAREIRAAFHGKAEEFILSYTKLAVTEENDYCRVQVRASIPPDEIRGRLRQAGILSAGEKRKNSLQDFQIRIRGAQYLSGLHIFRTMLNGMNGVSRPRLQEMTTDEALISVAFPGSSRELAGILAGAQSDFLTVTVRDIREDGVVIELQRTDMQ